MKTIQIPKGVKIACGKKIMMPWDSEHPENGSGLSVCGDDIICKECAAWNNAN